MDTGLQGQLKKSQLPYAMGDLYKPEADGLGQPSLVLAGGHG